MKNSMIFAIAFIGLMILFGYMHEVAHKQIFTYFDVESHIDMWEVYEGLPAMLTIPEEPCPNDTCHLAHSINESIGYQLQCLFLLLGLGLFFIISIMEKQWAKKKYLIQSKRIQE